MSIVFLYNYIFGNTLCYWCNIYFGLRLFPVWHIGSNYLHEIAKSWYQYLLDKGVNFLWNQEVHDINLGINLVLYHNPKTAVGIISTEYPADDKVFFNVE